MPDIFRAPGIRIELSWSVAPLGDGRCLVKAEWLGQHKEKTWGPMPGHIVDNFIRAKREQIDRLLRSKGAVKILGRAKLNKLEDTDG